MKVLGINGSGWLNVTHDPSVALIINRKIVCAAEEERFTRKKRGYDSLPFNSIKFCLDYEKLNLDDIDYIAFGWDWKRYGLYGVAKKLKEKDIINKFFPKKYFNYDNKLKIKFIEHHKAHASSVFRCSGLKKSGILILDGQGEYCSASIWLGDKDKIKKLWHNKIEDSLGYFYSSICRFIGMKNGDEGKLMGLASYGKSDQEIIDKLKSIKIKLTKKDYLSRSGQHKQIVNQWISNLEGLFGSKNDKDPKYNKNLGSFYRIINFNKFQKNLAASAQKLIEEKIMNLVDKTIRLTKSKNICLAGGVAMNCVANQRILENKKIDKLYIPPASNDAGVAIGAALELASELGYSSKIKMDPLGETLISCGFLK